MRLIAKVAAALILGACGASEPERPASETTVAELKNPSALDDVPRCGQGPDYACPEGAHCTILRLKDLGNVPVCTALNADQLCDQLLSCPAEHTCLADLSLPGEVYCSKLTSSP